MDESDRLKLVQEQRENLVKEKKTLEKKMVSLAKRQDHLERARREEEAVLLVEKYAEQKVSDKDIWEEQQKAMRDAHKLQHQKDLAEKNRLSRMLADKAAFEKQVMEQRKEEFEAMKIEHAQRMAEEREQRKRDRAARKRAEEVKREQAEEQARLAEEEQQRMQEEMQAVKIQAVARGKRDRKAAQDKRQVVLDEQEASAATKIQAIRRGQMDRRGMRQPEPELAVGFRGLQTLSQSQSQRQS